MYKLSYELSPVNKCLRLKVIVIYRDNLNKYKVYRSAFNGNDYLTVKIYPYFVLDITNDLEKREAWCYAKSMALTRFDIFKFIQMSQPLIESFTKDQNLFVYDTDHRLKINKELANKKAITIPLSFNKSIWITPVVVKEQDSSVEMEGVMMCFNTTSNYVTMTYDEFRFLLYYMDKVDLENIAMQLITFAEVTGNKRFNDIDKLPDANNVAPQVPTRSKPDGSFVSGFNPLINRQGEIPII